MILTDRDRLLEEYNQASFAAWEATLFLDTHPNHRDALAYHQHFTGLADRLRAKYERLYGPLTSAAAGGCYDWDWVQGPWPWQNHREV